MQVVSRRQSGVRVSRLRSLMGSQEKDHEDQADTAGEETEEEEESEAEENNLGEVRERAGPTWGCRTLKVPQPRGGEKQRPRVKGDRDLVHGCSTLHFAPKRPANKALPCCSLS